MTLDVVQEVADLIWAGRQDDAVATATAAMADADAPALTVEQRVRLLALRSDAQAVWALADGARSDALRARRAAAVWVGAMLKRADRLEALAAERGASVLIDATTHAALAGRTATDATPLAVLPGSAAAVAAHALRAR